MSDQRVVSIATFLRAFRQRLHVETVRDAGEAAKAAEDVLEKSPTQPDLVGPTVAAEMVGMQPSHVSRAVSAGRFPKPIDVEGSGRAFYRKDIEEFAAQRERERAEREQARQQKADG